ATGAAAKGDGPELEVQAGQRGHIHEPGRPLAARRAARRQARIGRWRLAAGPERGGEGEAPPRHAPFPTTTTGPCLSLLGVGGSATCSWFFPGRSCAAAGRAGYHVCEFRRRGSMAITTGKSFLIT